ncbi:substrate-binding domain-containing protein [Kaistia dalseonensis]|uniref:Ribose transport system substrate-binding protein n=1 Tax=Kaistia dalseonensis TaxID=410840 RepID=A0ABU0H2V7_9HYPH|nr:substrate-binding domain-containing protein [Kaistia dalseonensis]MCX5494066.1 substrate-binding domain-containing protein [Kaistia dalseonensis]MDQ0436644.1 ribose transport system substrate-binding protein [Kaistia dalseonensis]
MTIRKAAGALALLLTLGAAAQAAEKTILWVQPLRDHPVHKLMQAGFLDECKKLGYTCEIVGNPSASTWDVPATLPLAEAALASKKFDAVAVYTPDPAIYPFIAKLAADGLPVVTWHMVPAEGTVKGLLATTAEDVTEAGTNAGIAMGEKLGGKGTVAVTQSGSNVTENEMAASFKKALNAKYPDIKVLDVQYEGVEPGAARAKAVGILQANPDVTGAFSTTGYGPMTWSGAKRATGRDIVIISMDYTRQNLDLVKSGDVYGLVAQPLYEEGGKAAELAGAAADGQKLAYVNTLPAKVITASDLDPYYKILDSAGQ